MLPESVLNTLAGGLVAISGSLVVWVVRDYLETKKRRRNLINAIDSAARSCSVPAFQAAFVGRTGYFSPAEQFLATFWRDLSLLGTYTQMMVVSYFYELVDATRAIPPPRKSQLDALENLRQDVLKLLESEKKGRRQNINKNLRLSMPR